MTHPSHPPRVDRRRLRRHRRPCVRARARLSDPGLPTPSAALTPPATWQNTYIEVTVSCGKRLAATCYTSAFKTDNTEWNAIVDVEMAVHRVLTRAGFPDVSAPPLPEPCPPSALAPHITPSP